MSAALLAGSCLGIGFIVGVAVGALWVGLPMWPFREVRLK